ncbi:selenocysteine-specific translation elongation factor [soil metagenome]
MTLVIGTAGHIDHGKTTLLRALTGIDADRLPEERRRGLTIDVGYAHLRLDDGTELDFVDVPGHDRLVGNMLVGAGAIDACLLVVAADDGPRAQTLEHLVLLDALDLRHGLAVVTKVDLVDADRIATVEAEVAELLGRTSLSGAVVLAVSAMTGEGMAALREALSQFDRTASEQAVTCRREGVWLAIDRAFSVRGRGVVVTGSSLGAPIARGDRLVLLPEGRPVRAREVQVHDAAVDRGPLGGRAALNLSGVAQADVWRGQLLVGASPGQDQAAVATDRLLVALRRPALLPGRRADDPWPPAHGSEVRLHMGTEQVDALVLRNGRDGHDLPGGRVLALLRSDRPVATAAGERFVLRRPSPVGLLAGGVVLDPLPPRGLSRRRQTRARAAALADAVLGGASLDQPAAATLARLDLHGLTQHGSGIRLAPDLHAAMTTASITAVSAFQRDHPDRPGLPLTDLRALLVTALRRRARASRTEALAAAELVVEDLHAAGRLIREGGVVREPQHRPSDGDPAQERAADRLVAALDATLPPPLAGAAAEMGCTPDTVRALEREGRIVVLTDDLAWSQEAYARLRAAALDLARRGPLTPAALRDATGTSRKVVMAILEDLDRRGILRRTVAGHVPGPRA